MTKAKAVLGQRGKDCNALVDLANAARRTKNFDAAWQHVAAAKALYDADVPPNLLLCEALLHFESGNPDAAERILSAMLDQTPDAFWPAYHLAVAAWQRRDLPLTLARLSTLRALDPTGKIAAVWQLRVDIAQSADDMVAATDILQQMCEACPDDPWPHERLGQYALRAEDVPSALTQFEAALARAPHRHDLMLKKAQLLVRLKERGRAADAYDAIENAHGINPDVMMEQLRNLRQMDDAPRGTALLSKGLSQFPDNGDLWQQLFYGHLSKAPNDIPAKVVDLLRTRTKLADVDALAVRWLLGTYQYDKAYALCRDAGAMPRTQMQAAELAQSLLGTRRFQLGLRYLRFCLRCWPDSKMLLKIFTTWGILLGRGTMIARTIAPLQHLHSEVTTLEQDLLLAGLSNNCPKAVAAYRVLRARGHVTQAHQDLMCKLIATCADLEQVEAIFADIGNPLSESGRLPHRAGVPGALMLELEIIRNAQPSVLPNRTIVQQGSTVAAIRAVDAWAQHPNGRAADPIPKQIFQYWDAANPPAAVLTLMDSWRTAPGFAHRILSRQDALAFLREHYAPEWTDAFHLAANPSEEADLLRLCLLATFGGIYADADDYLYGDLDTVLCDGAGLVLYRETMGGTLGNNFLAAPPNHPVMRTAASTACAALLERSSELSWSKTGPAMLTRTVAHFIQDEEKGRSNGGITVLKPGQIERVLVMHNRLPYKKSDAHWLQAMDRSDPEGTLWTNALAVLEGLPEISDTKPT